MNGRRVRRYVERLGVGVRVWVLVEWVVGGSWWKGSGRRRRCRERGRRKRVNVGLGGVKKAVGTRAHRCRCDLRRKQAERRTTTSTRGEPTQPKGCDGGYHVGGAGSGAGSGGGGGGHRGWYRWRRSRLKVPIRGKNTTLCKRRGRGGDKRGSKGRKLRLSGGRGERGCSVIKGRRWRRGGGGGYGIGWLDMIGNATEADVCCRRRHSSTRRGRRRRKANHTTNTTCSTSKPNTASSGTSKRGNVTKPAQAYTSKTGP